MQLITEAWHNLAPMERAPFDARAHDEMQRYLQEERVYDQMQIQYSRLKQIAQQSGALAAPQNVAGPGQQQLQPQQLQVALNINTSTSSLLQAYNQAAAQANYRNQHQQQIRQQYAYQRQQEQRQQAAAAPQPKLRAAGQMAQQAQQRQQQAQQANPAAQTQHEQQHSALLRVLAKAVDRNNTAGRMPTAKAPQRPGPPPSSLQQQPFPGGKNPSPHSRSVRTPETVEIVCNGVNGTLIIAHQMVICGCSLCIQQPSQTNRTMSCKQFEIHAGAGGEKKWKSSLRVRPGTEPEVPRNSQPMGVGRWLELKALDTHTLPSSNASRLQGAKTAVSPAAQFSGARPGCGSSPPASGSSKVPLQYQWKGGPVGGGGGGDGGGGGGFTAIGGAFAPPTFKNSNPQQKNQCQQQQPPSSKPQQYYGGSAQRYSASAVASRQQERAAAAAAAAAAARSTGPAPADRPPSGSAHYKNATVVQEPTGKAARYTPWRDANDGKFTSINVRWSGDRCSVCEADTDYDYDQLITCDMCGITVHQSCYGVQDVSGVEKMWLCRACELHDNGRGNGSGFVAAQCCLCPIAGGALKPTTIQGVWAHVACLQWIPEVNVDDTELMEPISGIRSIHRDRWELVCYVCKQRMGAKIQCKLCCNAYHPLCARISGFRMEIKDGTRGPDGPVVCTSYCGKHSTPRPHLAGVRKVDESEAGGDLPNSLEKPRLWNCQPYPLPKCYPIANSEAGCARALEYNLSSRRLIRKQHGCGTGATTEAAFWIPGSMIAYSEEGQDEEEGKSRRREKKEDEGDVKKESEAEEEPTHVDGGDNDASKRISRRTKNKRNYNNGPGSADHRDGEQEGRQVESEKADAFNGITTETPGKPTHLTTATDTAKKFITAINTAVRRVDSPPDMRTVETSLRPAVKKPSAIDGERPPAKLRKLNRLHAEEKHGFSFTKAPAAPIFAVEVIEGDAAAATAAAAAGATTPTPFALVAGRLPSELVGHWCRVWWPEDNEWYLGVIREYSPAKGQFRVWYEVDNEAEWIDLGREARNKRVQLLDGEERNTWPDPLPIPADIPDGGSVKAEEINSGGGGGEEQLEVAMSGPAEGAAAVGRKVGIYWDDANRYYHGTVRSYRTDKGHLILYENGTADWVNLSNCRVDWRGTKRNAASGRKPSTTSGNGGASTHGKLDGDNFAITTADAIAPAIATDIKVSSVHAEDHQVPVICNGVRGIFFSKSMSVILTHSGKSKEVTPGEFERISGRGSAKKWKVTIRLDVAGQQGKTIESWLINHGIWGEDGKPIARNKYCTGNRLLSKSEEAQLHQQQQQLRGGARPPGESIYPVRKRQPTRIVKGKLSGHKNDCGCVICKQNRRRGAAVHAAGTAGSDINGKHTDTSATAAAATANRSGQQQLGGKNNKNNRQGNSDGQYGQDDGQFHDRNIFRTGKQAYLEAIPQVVSTGPRSLELYQAPPSRCWAPGEWAAHRLRYNIAREKKRSGGNNSLASLGQHGTLPVVVCGGSLAIRDDNIATVVSLGPGATGGGRTLTLKEKLDLCNATEHERLSFGKSGIHGWGIFAKVPMRQDTMVVEFRGELLRRSAAEMRQAKYLAQGADCYIFNLDDDVVLDATKEGTIARFTVRNNREYLLNVLFHLGSASGVFLILNISCSLLFAESLLFSFVVHQDLSSRR